MGCPVSTTYRVGNRETSVSIKRVPGRTVFSVNMGAVTFCTGRVESTGAVFTGNPTNMFRSPGFTVKARSLVGTVTGSSNFSVVNKKRVTTTATKLNYRSRVDRMDDNNKTYVDVLTNGGLTTMRTLGGDGGWFFCFVFFFLGGGG